MENPARAQRPYTLNTMSSSAKPPRPTFPAPNFCLDLRRRDDRALVLLGVHGAFNRIHQNSKLVSNHSSLLKTAK
jgi:hypothetical protein